MDMSFSFGDAVPIAAPRLRYAELLALVRGENGAAGSSNDDILPDTRSTPPLDRSLATTLLTDVLLGRPGWRKASLALGGRFAGGYAADAATGPDRKPV